MLVSTKYLPGTAQFTNISVLFPQRITAEITFYAMAAKLSGHMQYEEKQNKKPAGRLDGAETPASWATRKVVHPTQTAIIICFAFVVLRVQNNNGPVIGQTERTGLGE
jgi:hypothetical protein